MKRTARALSLVVLVFAAACGEESGPPALGAIQAGRLVGGPGESPGALSGVAFHTPSLDGFTASDGTFTYHEGEDVTFGVADVAFRPVAGSATISPWQLVGDGNCDQSDELTRLLVLLGSLDANESPEDGVAIDPFDATFARPFRNQSDADVAQTIARLIPGRISVDGVTALHRFIAQMDGEVWEQLSLDQFPLATGLVRSQGVATDGSSWFFSWQLGLERTALDYTVELSRQTAIPPEVAAIGGNHIGDIDYWDGTLYAPIEDGRAYLHPQLVLYDPATLAPRRIHALDDVPLPDGVPWVAVDGPRRRIYVAVWDPTPEIFVLDLDTLAYVGAVPLQRTLHRIQGAKVFEGSLYASTDNDDKDIFKINLDTGTVIPLFGLHQDFEEEGLVLLERPDGTLLHTLNVQNPARGTELRHHRRTRAPLRQSVCARAASGLLEESPG